MRTVRGGSFIHGANEIRSSYRRPLHPEARDHYTGFRVAAGDGPGRLAFDWVELPGGEVPVGRDLVPFGGPAAADEAPQHELELAAFSLSLTPVTNAQYARFVDETGAAAPGHWEGGAPPAELAEHPVALRRLVRRPDASAADGRAAGSRPRRSGRKQCTRCRRHVGTRGAARTIRHAR